MEEYTPVRRIRVAGLRYWKKSLREKWYALHYRILQTTFYYKQVLLCATIWSSLVLITLPKLALAGANCIKQEGKNTTK